MGGTGETSRECTSTLPAWVESIVWLTCIYNSPRVWATIKHYWPERVMSIARYEQSFGVTVSRKRIDVLDLSAGVSPIRISDVDALNQVSMEQYVLPVLVPAGQKWETPPGAFGREACGSN